MEWPRPWYQVLWAPWRMEYIKSSVESKGGGCVFCEAIKMSDEEALILYRGRRSFIIMNKYPYNTGHLMIVPFRHVASLEDLGEEELLEMSLLVKASLRALRRAYRPQGFNVGINIGRVAGAGVEDHVHIHVVPRWSGDANFMLITGATKVIPQDLRDTYSTLKPILEEEASRLLERGGAGR